jgi:hypothetical protein
MNALRFGKAAANVRHVSDARPIGSNLVPTGRAALIAIKRPTPALPMGKEVASLCSREARMRTRSEADRPAGRRALVALAVALLCGGCETPALKTDAVYPADWPQFVEVGEKCLGLESTYANRGRYVDDAGKAGDAWLTDILAAMPTPREGAELSSLHLCERVTLRIESFPSRARSDLMMQRAIAVPVRRVGEGSSEWADCESIHLPRGPGWPWVGNEGKTYESGTGLCQPKRFFYYNPHPGGLGWIPGLFIELARGTDNSLIVKVWREGSPTAKAWAHFAKAP